MLSNIKQTWAVLGVLLNMLGQGMVLSFPSVILPAIMKQDSDIKVDLNTASWVASCIGIASMPGFLLSSLLMDIYGRKLAHAVVIPPVIVGWALIWSANNVTVLLIGRCLCGLAAGATVSLGAVVIGEYTSPKNRGMFLNLKTTAVCVGNMVVHIFGHYYSWRTVALVALVPHTVALLIIFTWPESPSWLAAQKRYEQSKKSFYWLRGKSKESTSEIEELIRAQKERAEYSVPSSMSSQFKEFAKKFTKKDFVKPLVIIFFSGLLLESCGRHIFPAYALQIIEEITGSKSSSFYYTLAIDLIITASSLFSSVLVKLMKRRTLLFSSGFASLFILACVCLYLYLASTGIVSNQNTWIPIGLFSIYFILVNLGSTPIPLALLGEIFPLAHRGAGTSVSGIILSFYVVGAMQVTPYLLVSLKVHGSFTVFGALMALALVVLYFIIPETKDKTLQQIENYFNFGKFTDDEKDRDGEANLKMLPQ